MKRIIILALLVFALFNLKAQQIPDLNFKYTIRKPAYPKGHGPVIVLDQAHFNFHTLDGRYHAFGKVLADDGYVVKPGIEKFTRQYLNKIKILAIANALGDTGEWKLPQALAFSNDEVKEVEKWVNEGGNLFLIADHMPCAGAAANLATAFGFNFINGFAMKKALGREMFSRTRKNLTDNPITRGNNSEERIDSIEMFTGSAFIAPSTATIITTLSSDYIIELPSVAWEFSGTTAKISGMHFVNGAMLQYGKGRIVIFGEAAMFSAQLQGPYKLQMGMNMPTAKQNPQLLLNIIHWLDGKF